MNRSMVNRTKQQLQRTLLIDNYDSYSFNLFQLVKEVTGIEPLVVQNDDFLSWGSLKEVYVPFKDFYSVIISPGPGSPEVKADVKISQEALEACKREGIPVLGVCLGHQLIALSQGLKVCLAENPMHGRLSEILHVGESNEEHIFYQISSGFKAVRYHSLIVKQSDDKLLNDQVLVEGKTSENEIMALKLKIACPTWGVQFHPESISTEFGHKMIENFLTLAQNYLRRRGDIDNTNRNTQISSPISESNQKKNVASEKKLFVLELDIKNSTFELEGFSKKYRRCGNSESCFFWLDSENFGLQNNFSNSRFSYVGDSSGSFSKAFSYSIRPDRENKKGIKGICKNYVKKYGSADQWEVASTENVDYFEWLESELKEIKNNLSVCIIKNARDRLDAIPGDHIENVDVEIPFMSGFVGFLGYRMRALCGVKSSLHKSTFSLDNFNFKPQANGEDEFVPDAFHMFADRLVAIDHQKKKAFLMCYVGDLSLETYRTAQNWLVETKKVLLEPAPPSDENPTSKSSGTSTGFESEVPDHEYIRQIKHCKDQIVLGETYEVCLTKRLVDNSGFAKEMQPLELYCSLRRRNAAPFSAFFDVNFSGVDDCPDCCFSVCSTSPERFVKISATRAEFLMESKPIKGTMKRGIDKAEDVKLKQQLYESEKDRSENLMIVDLVRNDFGMVCDIVSVEKLFDIETFATVHQMVSTIIGKVDRSAEKNKHKTTVDLIRACFPGGSMTGAPKKRTLDIIDSLEVSERGVYSGCFGYFSLCGNADSSIVIRTVVCTANGISAGTGGAIVHLSTAEEELEETRLKVRALENTLYSTATTR